MSQYREKLEADELEKVLLMNQTLPNYLKVMENVHSKYFNKFKGHDHYFKTHFSGVPFCDVHPILEPFIGSYSVKNAVIPKWFASFRSDLTYWLCDMTEKHAPEINEEISNYAEGVQLSKRADKIINLFKAMSAMTPEQFDEGKLGNGQKIIKSIISAIEVGIGKKDLKPEDTTWYKMFEGNKAAGGGKRFVLSNARLAKLGISSMFSGHAHSSCQKIESNSGTNSHANGIYNFANDPNSLVIYEVGTPIHFYGLKDDIKFDSMKWRSILRLIDFTADIYYKCDGCGTYTTDDKAMCSCSSVLRWKKAASKTFKHDFAISIDAFYPNAEEFPSLFKVVKSIADEVGIPVVISNRSHYTASGSHTKLNIDKESANHYGSYGKHIPISHAINCEACKQFKAITKCDSCKPVDKEVCNACQSVLTYHKDGNLKCKSCRLSSVCQKTSCIGCSLTRCTYDESPRAMYLDQLSGKSRFPMSDDGFSHICDVFHILKGVS